VPTKDEVLSMRPGTPPSERRRLVASHLKERGAHIIDPTDELVQVRGQQDIFEENGTHPLPAGYRIIGRAGARAMLSWLR
jgi:hypothetical protein